MSIKATRSGHDGSVQRRREALRKVMEQHELTPKEWATAAGLPRANALYAFLKAKGTPGAPRPNSLHVETLEKLAAAIPGVTVSELLGEKLPDRPSLMGVVPLRHLVSGKWEEALELPQEEQITIGVPEAQAALKDAFGVRVASPEMDRVIAAGSVVICVAAGRRKPQDGDIVIAERWHTEKGKRRVRLLLRRLSVAEGKGWLLTESRHPSHIGVIVLDHWPALEAVNEGDRVVVTGVATGAFIRL